MSKVTELAELQTPAAGDLLPIIDVSDLSMSGTGTNKKITYGDLLGDYATSEDLQAALPTPLEIEEGRTFVVPANIQMPFSVPIEINGTLEINGVLYEV